MGSKLAIQVVLFLDGLNDVRYCIEWLCYKEKKHLKDRIMGAIKPNGILAFITSKIVFSGSVKNYKKIFRLERVLKKAFKIALEIEGNINNAQWQSARKNSEKISSILENGLNHFPKDHENHVTLEIFLGKAKDLHDYLENKLQCVSVVQNSKVA